MLRAAPTTADATRTPHRETYGEGSRDREPERQDGPLAGMRPYPRPWTGPFAGKGPTEVAELEAKTRRQPKWVTRKPPSVGPATTARPARMP